MNRSQGFATLAAFGFSFILIFSTLLKNSGMSSLEQVFLRLSISLALLVLGLLCVRQLRLPRRKDIPFFTTMGFVFSIFMLSSLSALILGAPIPVVVALVYTQPIFTALISHITRKEKITLPKFGVILIGVVGVFLASGLRKGNMQISLGIVFSIFGGFLYAVYLWLKRRIRREDYTPTQTLFNTFMFAIPSTLVIGMTLRIFSQNPLFVGITIPNTHQFALIFLFAIFSTLIPYSALNYVKAEELSPTAEGLALLGDPLLHTLWATLFFQQYLSFTQYIGAALILSSAALNLKITSKIHDK